MSTEELQGKVAIVTGAAGGIGFEIARALTDSGVRVVLVDRDAPALDRALERLGTESGAVPMVVDLGGTSTLAHIPDQTVEKLGRLDILVNCAGVRLIKPLMELDRDDWQQTIDVSLIAPFLLTQASIPHMSARGDGRIVNIASVAGLSAFAERAPYGAAKAGLVLLTKSVAMEHGKDGIRCNAIAPGLVETPMTAAYFEKGGRGEAISNTVPLGRPAQPAEIAGPVVFLCTSAADYINGAVLTVDGGWTSGHM